MASWPASQPVEMHIDTKSRIDIIAILLYCIDIFIQYIGICKSFHQVINFSAQSQKCECLHSHTMQREREREREKDAHDFLVNPWNKNVYFVCMSVRYKTQNRRQSKPCPRSSCLLDSSCSTFRQNLKREINRHWKWVSFLWNIQRVKWVMNKQRKKKINVWSNSLLVPPPPFPPPHPPDV